MKQYLLEVIVTRKKNEKIYSIADYIVNSLLTHGFTIQRYNAYKTNSVYLKLDFGVCNSIRISDHDGKEHLCYRYNLIIGCSNDIVEEKYIRYYYNESSVNDLLNLILFDKREKIKKYGIANYRIFMNMNKNEHKNDEKGFWTQAKLIEN